MNTQEPAETVYDAAKELLDNARAQIASLRDAAEMLWIVLAQLDWTTQSQEWQTAATRWRDNYFAVITATEPPRSREH